MKPSTARHHPGTSSGMPAWLILVAFVGSLAALFGGYWDDAWHTERGRDSFFIVPHILIYAGVAGVGAALGLWVAGVARREGVRSALSRPTVRLAAVSVGVTLASGAIDDIWHRAFGRDAVIWSPPHMLGIVGTMVLGATLLAETPRRPWLASVAAGGLVLAAANFVVAEYDTDVPQFDAIWYLPALAMAAGAAFGLVRMLAARPWAATAAAAAQLAFVMLTGGLLLAQGFAPPALPLLLAPAAALDVAFRRGWRSGACTAAFVAALFAVYVPVRNGLGEGISIDALDVLVGVPLAFAAALPFIALANGHRITLRPSRRAVLTAALVVMVLLPATSALAHDPGQGKDAGVARFSVTADSLELTATGALGRKSCSAVRDGRLVARRAGAERRTRLALDGCEFTGTLTVGERGRWFVYAELQERNRTVEVWLPVQAGSGRERVSDRQRFVYVPADGGTSVAKIVGGAVLYAAMLALVISAFRALRPGEPAPAS